MQTHGIDFELLDEFQRPAAALPLDANGNIVAGAGTGKTTVLVARYMKLLEDDGVAPDRILALTFTLKAAGEMRERVRAAVAARMPQWTRRLEAGWILNFHQFGYRFIQENAPALAIDPGIGVMSLAEFHRIKAALRARFENGRLHGIPADFGGEPPAPTKLPALFDLLFSIAQKCRGNMIDAAELRARCDSHEQPAYLAHLDAVAVLVRAWEDELRRRNLLDFDDMIAIPTRALREHPELRERYHGEFDHILVDEFQDTSRAQNEMLRAIAGDDFARVTVVGDVKQSIYRWRDARPENVMEFPARLTELRKNYRSVQEVLDLAHDLVEGEPLLKGFVAPLTAHRGHGRHQPVLFHPTVEDADDEEARALADWIDYLTGRAPAPPAWKLPAIGDAVDAGRIAVLLRSVRSRTRARIEAEFTRRGIAYAIVGGASTAEATALQAWRELLLLLLPGPRAVNLLAVLESKPYRVSEASLHELYDGADRRGGTAALLSDDRIARITDEADRRTVRELRDCVTHLSSALRELGFRAFLEWAIERTPLRFELATGGVSSGAVDDVIRELLDLCDTLSQRGLIDLATFLDHLGADLDERKFREDVDVRLPAGRIAVMTIHQAKGLEFDAVAVPGVGASEGRSDDFLVSPEHGIYLRGDDAKRWKRHMKDSPDYDTHREQEKLEERCILYVALTRARDHLWVSSPLPDGARQRKTTGPSESHFTHLLRAGRKRGIVSEVREAGPVRAVAAAAAADPAAAHELESALRGWTAVRVAAEARDLQPPAPARALETVTWASLARFETCPLAFQFDRTTPRASTHDDDEHDVPLADLPVVRLPKGVDPAEFGAYVHAVLERRTDMETALDQALVAISQRHDFGKHAATVMDLARERIRAGIAAGFAGPSSHAQSELPFTIRAGRVLVHGVIDRLDDDGKDTLITDYKLGAPSPDYHFQVCVYAWAARKVLGRDVRAQLVYLGHDPVDVEAVAADHARIDVTVTAMDAALTSGEFEPRPGKVCTSCSHRAHCRFADNAPGPP